MMMLFGWQIFILLELKLHYSCSYQLLLGLDTLCFYFCLLFYSFMLSSHALCFWS